MNDNIQIKEIIDQEVVFAVDHFMILVVVDQEDQIILEGLAIKREVRFHLISMEISLVVWNVKVLIIG